jgi:putative tryptophan/tyrosine transport system substrate-binding protein
MGTAAHVKLKWRARCAALRVGQRLAIRPTKDDVWWTGLTRRVAESVTAWGALNGRWWPWSGVLVVLFVGSGLLLGSVGAATPANPFRIGVLTDAWGPTPGIVGLRDGLLALGYHEEEQFVMGVRFTQGDVAALPAAARELVEHGVDLIFAMNTNTAKAAQQATSHIPIVFGGGVDPVGDGLIQSFARSGSNITGVTDLTLELGPKRLQVFQELMPGLKRVVFPYDAADAASVTEAKSYRDAARHLGIVLVERPVRTQEEAQAALAQLQRGDSDGLLKPRSLALNIPGFVLEAATQRAIPVMADGAFWVEKGVLASYGPDFYDTGRQAARLVEKILKGTKPAEIPVEVNEKIEFVINLKTAHALGLTIAPAVLFQAHRLIR